MNFKDWLENEADIPMRDENGNWYDAETGLAYNSQVSYSVTRKSVSADAKGFREYAKQFGGKALTGSAKQKEWAEKIRYNALQNANDEIATLLCVSEYTQNSAFWINFRNENANELAERLNKINEAKLEAIKAKKAYLATADERGLMNKNTPEHNAYYSAYNRYVELQGK